MGILPIMYLPIEATIEHVLVSHSCGAAMVHAGSRSGSQLGSSWDLGWGSSQMGFFFDIFGV